MRSFLLRPAVVVMSVVVLLAGGIALAAATTTTTNPITLCAPPKSGPITTPNDGTCARGTAEFLVASDTDVQALATRLDELESADPADDPAVSALAFRVEALEADNAALGRRLTRLEKRFAEGTPWFPSLSLSSYRIGFDTYHYVVEGSNLQPGAEVIAQRPGAPTGVIGVVKSDGTFRSASGFALCGLDPPPTGLSYTSTDAFGEPVTSNTFVDPCRF
jgi:hypothetical protein